MKRIMKKVLVCCVIGIFVLDASQALAWSGGGNGNGEDRGERMERVAQELGLSQEQKDALKSQKEASRANKAAVREEVKAAREALKAALRDPATDRAAVNVAAARVKSAQGIRVDQRVESFLSMKDILTPEQFQKMLDMKGDGSEKRSKRRRGKEVSESDNL